MSKPLRQIVPLNEIGGLLGRFLRWRANKKEIAARPQRKLERRIAKRSKPPASDEQMERDMLRSKREWRAQWRDPERTKKFYDAYYGRIYEALLKVKLQGQPALKPSNPPEGRPFKPQPAPAEPSALARSGYEAKDTGKKLPRPKKLLGRASSDIDAKPETKHASTQIQSLLPGGPRSHLRFPLYHRGGSLSYLKAISEKDESDK